jgi:hypothetical protein
MADYYTHFSFVVDVKNREQADGLKKMLTDAANEELLKDEDELLSTPWSLEDEGDLTIFWIRSDESGQVDLIVDILAKWQEDFKYEQPICFEWAYTCSKPRLNAFGGGSVLIHKGEAHYTNTFDWLTKKKAELGIVD